MDHPALNASSAQQSQFRSAAVSPSVAMSGARFKMARFARKPVQTAMAPFAQNVRSAPYAARRLSTASPQAFQQLLEAFLVHHGMQ